MAQPAASCSISAHSKACVRQQPFASTRFIQYQKLHVSHLRCGCVCTQRHSRSARHLSLRVTNTYPEPETEKERSTLDFPQEWITPQPSRRPDIFPEFEKLETPLPKPLPGDPSLPDEEEEEEKKKEEPEKDPEEEPEKPETPQPEE